MIQVYSKKLLSPYTGQMQIVESERARALTLDGKEWVVQFTFSARVEALSEAEKPGRAFKFDYIRVANISGNTVQRQHLPPYLNAADVVQQLASYVADIELPLPAADHYEYWLLDNVDNSPLALIYSCVRAEEMSLFPQKLEWTALSAAMMKVESTEAERVIYTPPVNYRLERLVNERAGKKPKAKWIKRRADLHEAFPALLVREDWQ